MKYTATAPPAYPSRRRGRRRFAMDYHRGDTPVARRACANRSELISGVVDGTGLNGWDYDNIGNRRMEHRSDGYEIYTANRLNQYTAIEDSEGTFTPTYDADGNQTRVKTSTGIWNVTYNAKNRPILFTKDDNSVSVACTYDYMGRRATKKVTENGIVTLHQRYLYRGYLQIACCDLLRSNEPCLWLITWDPTQPIATRPLAIQKDGTWYTYGWDLTKNVWEVYGATGYIGTAYTYTAYGQVTASGTVEQPIQWSSEYNDSELGLVYYNYRHFNPNVGRWLNRDPFFPNSNIYNYVNNSISYIHDNLGLSEVVCQEKSAWGGNVYDAYDLKLEQIDPLSKKCELELSMLVQFFFTPYQGKKWTQNEKEEYINNWIKTIKDVWENETFLSSPQKCCYCSGNIKLKLHFDTKIQGYTTSDNWELVAKKDPGRSNVMAIFGKVRLYNDPFIYSQRRKEDGNIYKQRTAAHEFGHMIGIKDEYNGVAGEQYKNDYNSIMNIGESLRNRHFSNIQSWINNCCDKKD